MNNSRFLAVLFLVLPLTVTAQTKSTPKSSTKTIPAPATQQVTEVTEELDPETGKVIRRTTRTITVPVGTPAATAFPRASPMPKDTPTTALNNSQASDAQATAFFRRKITIATLTTSGLLEAYSRFLEKVHTDRHSWKATDWATASAVLSSLNARYEQLRPSLKLDDKLTIRSQQAEYQALRTARQLSDQVSDKL